LGEGGSGVTYRAVNTHSQQLVALKALSLRRVDDWKAIELFEREAQVLSTLNCDGIPKYIDYFNSDLDGDLYFYIVQELAPGKTLSEWMKSGWRATEAEIKTIAIQILDLLIYLHRHQPPIVHRDLKPSNILKTEDGKISLVDFGAVQQTYHDTFMRGSTVVGTYGYMAPEQFRGQAVPATDLYGLGATILHLLTHRSPAEIPQDGLRLNFRDRLEVSSSFADWLERMLEPDVSSRFSSAQKALNVLKHPPKSKFKPTFTKFDRIGIGIGSAIFLSLIFGIFYSSKYYWLGMAGIVSKEPFLAISSQANIENIQHYLDRGFDINSRDSNNYSLIYYAMKYNRPEIVKLLIKRGADLRDSANLLDRDLENTKQRANAKLEREKQSVYEYGIGYELKNQQKTQQEANESIPYYVNSILDYAIQKNNLEILNLLLDRGVKIDRKYPHNHMTPLHLAVLHPDGEMVKLLLNRGVDPNIEDRLGCTPLHIAILQEEMPYESAISNYFEFSSSSDSNRILDRSILQLVSNGADVEKKCLIRVNRIQEINSKRIYKRSALSGVNNAEYVTESVYGYKPSLDNYSPLQLAYILQKQHIIKILNRL
jgi:serine/threonine protein kinase